MAVLRIATFWTWRRPRRLPLYAKLVIGFCLFLALYLPLLELVQRREEARLAAERADASMRYLHSVRAHHGFRGYLQALADLRHFGDWREEAPAVLIGAWARVPADAAVPGERPATGSMRISRAASSS